MSNTKTPVETKKELEKKADQVKEQEFDQPCKNFKPGDFKRLNPQRDDRFGEFALFQNLKTSQIVMAKERVLNSEKDARLEIAQYKSREELNHRNIQKFYGFSSKTESGFCSKFFKVNGYYEFPDSDLKKLIQERKKSGTDFTSEELTLMAYHVLHALYYLHFEKNRSFVDLRPENISFSRDTRENKLLDRLKEPAPDALSANKSHQLANRPYYCSPAIWEALKKKLPNLKHDESKSDCWSLGMCILEAATLDNLQDIYLPDGNIDYGRLNNHMQLMGKKYGEENKLICELTSSLLTIKEEDRMDSKSYIDQLQPYDVILSHFDAAKVQGGQPQQQKQISAQPNFIQPGQADERKAGPQGLGPQGAGPQGPGPQGAGPQGPGPQGPGPQGAGPQGPGPQGFGPQTGGQQGPGAQAQAQAGLQRPDPQGPNPMQAGNQGSAAQPIQKPTVAPTTPIKPQRQIWKDDNGNQK